MPPDANEPLPVRAATLQDATAPPPPPVSTQPPPPLDYASPGPPRFPKLRAVLRSVADWGPWFPRPSWATLVIFVLCCAAAFAVARRPEPWRLVRTDAVWASRSSTSRPDRTVVHLPKTDAIFAADASGRLRVFSPWTGQTLLSFGNRGGDVRWLGASADETRLISQTRDGTFIWDARTGRRLAKLTWGPNSYLGPHVEQHGMEGAALSPDGSRLFMLDQQENLLLWDVTGAQGRLLAMRPKVVSGHVWQPVMSYAPDGRRVLLASDGLLWLGDADTLEPIVDLRPPDIDQPIAAFIDGGARLLVTAHGNVPFGSTVREYDATSGQLLRSWPISGHAASQILVSPDERAVYVASQFGLSAWIDRRKGGAALKATDDALRRSVPANQPAWGDAAFFPDSRRMLSSNVHDHRPGIIDVNTGRHIANLPIPRPPRGAGRSQPPLIRHMIASPDGRHAAAVAADGRVFVYAQVGEESPWGVIASPRFRLLVAAVLLLALSLTRDALRTRAVGVRVPRLRAAAAMLMILAGAGAAVWPLTWAAIGAFDEYTWWYRGWVVWGLVLCLFAGLGLLMASVAWDVLARLVLGASVVFAALTTTSSAGALRFPERVFDRSWVLDEATWFILGGTWALLSAVALLAVLTTPRTRPHPTPRAPA